MTERRDRHGPITVSSEEAESNAVTQGTDPATRSETEPTLERAKAAAPIRSDGLLEIDRDDRKSG